MYIVTPDSIFKVPFKEPSITLVLGFVNPIQYPPPPPIKNILLCPRKYPSKIVIRSALLIMIL